MSLKLLNKIKTFITLFLVFSIVLMCCQTNQVFCFAREQHDETMIKILLSDSYSISKNSEEEKYIKMLEAASYLAIDQYNKNGLDKLNYLKKDAKVKGLPKLEDIDFTAGSEHRKYTHLGWNYKYSNENKVYDRWNTRKGILLKTINKIFDFGFFNELFGKCCDKCNSFGAIIYYIHILGDYEAADDYKKIQTLTPLAGKMEIANDKDKDYDMITSLKSYINVLFSNQDTADLIKELEKIEKKASKIQKSVGGVNTDEEFKEYHGYAIDVLETLKQYIPDLLYEEDFFRSVFYPTE